MERITWRLDGQFKGDAAKCYEECETLNEATPANVLALAMDENTELHKCFEWDDSAAAQKYRLGQARDIIRSFVIVREDKKDEPIRAFQITTQTNVYQPTRLFLQQPDEYSELLKRAKAELAAFKQRYKMLSELEEIFNEIDKL